MVRGPKSKYILVTNIIGLAESAFINLLNKFTTEIHDFLMVYVDSRQDPEDPRPFFLATPLVRYLNIEWIARAGRGKQGREEWLSLVNEIKDQISKLQDEFREMVDKVVPEVLSADDMPKTIQRVTHLSMELVETYWSVESLRKKKLEK
jgi:hypothetical protein